MQPQETPEQVLARKLDDLQALGYFDQQQYQDEIIDPEKYETKENRDYIKQARDRYMSICTAQKISPTP